VTIRRCVRLRFAERRFAVNLERLGVASAFEHGIRVTALEIGALGREGEGGGERRLGFGALLALQIARGEVAILRRRWSAPRVRRSSARAGAIRVLESISRPVSQRARASSAVRLESALSRAHSASARGLAEPA
jgi:hypothetical protein